MTDIVERLRELERVERELAHDGDCPPEATANWRYAETCKSAANEIERLRAALRECEAELDVYYRVEYPGGHPYSIKKLKEAMASNPARAALKEEGDD